MAYDRVKGRAMKNHADEIMSACSLLTVIFYASLSCRKRRTQLTNTNLCLRLGFIEPRLQCEPLVLVWNGWTNLRDPIHPHEEMESRI